MTNLATEGDDPSNPYYPFLSRCVLVMGVIVTAVISSLPLLENCEQNGTLVKVLWIILMAVMFSTFPGCFPIMAASIRDAFGPAHYRANFGLLFTITVAYYAVLLICSQVPAVFDYLDFRGMFLLAGGVRQSEKVGDLLMCMFRWASLA